MDNTSNCGHKGRNRIVGGETTADGEVPWQCSILSNTGEWTGCGAVLLSCEPSIIVTAAHCFPGGVIDYGLQVACGTNIRHFDYTEPTEYEQRRAVERVIIHPDYNPSTNKNDIALVKLDEINQFDCNKRHLYPACLPAKMDYAGFHKTMVTGWGRTNETENPSSVLLKARVPVRSDSMCQEAFHLQYGVQYANMIDGPTMLCAGQPNVDSCQGDSGGPLVVQDDDNSGWSLIGIVSWGIGCARQGTYGVYSEVSHYIPWIAHTYGFLSPVGYEQYQPEEV